MSTGREPSVELDLERLEALLERYVGDGPRYTSYPTAPVWSEAYGEQHFRDGLARMLPEARERLSLYLHVPFCRSLCHFCACNRVITRKEELPARYLDALEREIATLREALAGDPRVTQLHWGGGTPTHLQPLQIRRLARALRDAFPLRRDAEVSIEVDPRVTGPAHVEVLSESGFNRISLGVQDFDARVQNAIHRVQSVEETAALAERARRAGFLSVNFDLIYGLPFQSEASFRRTLDTVLALAPDRIALYAYAHVTWVARQQRGFERHDLPTPEERLRLFVLAIRRFLEAGYVHVGMDHFAKPQDELSEAQRERTLRRNFMGYTTRAGSDLLGLGPSAISELSDAYAQSRRDLESWEAAVCEPGLATFRGHLLSEEDQARRFVISRLMCHGEVRAEEYRAAFGESFADRHAAELEALAPMEDDGLVVRAGDGSVRVTSLGRLLVRNVAMTFDAYLPEQRRSGGRLFSRTV